APRAAGSRPAGGTRPRLRQVLRPDRVDVGHHAVGAGEHEPRGVGLPAQAHVGLLRRAVALLGVARLAAGHDVLPGGGAAAAAGDHVVEGQVVGAAAAVLADVVVAPVDVLAGVRHALTERRANVALQPDHAGD